MSGFAVRVPSRATTPASCQVSAHLRLLQLGLSRSINHMTRAPEIQGTRNARTTPRARTETRATPWDTPANLDATCRSAPCRTQQPAPCLRHTRLVYIGDSRAVNLTHPGNSDSREHLRLQSVHLTRQHKIRTKANALGTHKRGVEMYVSQQKTNAYTTLV